MISEIFKITDDSEVSLTSYISDISEEMKNMKTKPAILVLPGGAYKFCSDREAEPVALAYLAKGFNAFVLRYSLNEKAEFPTPLNDAQKALAFIRKNAEKFHTDPQKIAVIGFSAGGHLAAARQQCLRINRTLVFSAILVFLIRQVLFSQSLLSPLINMLLQKHRRLLFLRHRMTAVYR